MSDIKIIGVAQKEISRRRYAAESLARQLQSSGFNVEIKELDKNFNQYDFVLATRESRLLNDLVEKEEFVLDEGEPKAEGFVLKKNKGKPFIIAGADDSGILYGCLELSEKIKLNQELPVEINLSNAPEFKLRGPCIGIQKPTLLEGRNTYEYPYTPENFPFFYDKEEWLRYLNFLVENRMNTLYLWNGHPFASLLKLEKYPEAQEVSDEILQKNQEIYSFITEEADKRGIWVIQNFYNIFVSKPFAEEHDMETQHRAPTPLLIDYNRECIREFMIKYPHVGLLVCLGEAIRGTENDIEFFREAIIKGVKSGMRELGKEELPPLILRAHASSPEEVMEASLPHYSNLYTMAKFNGESLTTYMPRGRWQDIHLTLSNLGSVHMANVHILANLEPFRYGAQRYIKKCVRAIRDRLGGEGLHLYPLNFWDWPYTPDNAKSLLKQIDRDWIWFESWARYSWEIDREPDTDRKYWLERLREKYGCGEGAKYILQAYNDSGECAPRILRRFGITGGNRQSMSLGMFLDQLVNPEDYRAWFDLWESDAPPGERINTFVEREWEGKDHQGETPLQIIDEVIDYSYQALVAINEAEKYVTKNREEFARLKNDIECIYYMSRHYCAKARAALLVVNYQYSQDIENMEEALVYMEKSYDFFRRLTEIAGPAYRYSNSMQTPQRQVPVKGKNGRGKGYNHHWEDLVEPYKNELANFKKQVDNLKKGRKQKSTEIQTWPAAQFKLVEERCEKYTLQKGSKVFSDQDYAIKSLAPELKDLEGIQFSTSDFKKGKTEIVIENQEPVKVLIGFFDSEDDLFEDPPNLEEDASADKRGGLLPVLKNALTISDLPPVNIHAFKYKAGKNKLKLFPGMFIIAGVIPAGIEIETRDAGKVDDNEI